jgi:benzoate-CoA ligase family protein
VTLAYEDIPRELNLATHFVDRHLDEGRGGRTALIAGERDWSYADLAGLMNRAGNVLRELGVRRGERVLLALGDGPEFVAVWYAAQKIGAVTAEVYTFMKSADFAYYLGYTQAAVAVVDDLTLERFREAAAGSGTLRSLLVVGARPEDLREGEAHFETLAAEAPAELEAAPTGRDDIALWKFTTGSTGSPKACVHPTHSPLLSADWYARGVLGMSADDVVLPVPKLFFGYARDMAALFPFLDGGAGIVFGERTTPELIFGLCERHHPTILVNVPTMMASMLDFPGGSREALASLRLCTSAGEGLPAALHSRWLDAFGVEVLDGIGSSEAYHIYISNRPGAARAGSTGQAVPGYRARVVGEDGRELPDGEVGRLWVEGHTAALMYWDAPEATERTFDGDLVMTGDLFERGADGFFSYRGRADDLLKVGGIWVAPAEIEHCLVEHPDVVECAVVGYERDGLTLPRAHVVVRGGAGVTADALRAFVKERLSPHKQPRDVRFHDSLPKTGSGKVDRRALRALD